MNNVQTNLMNVAPAPNATTKVNAAEAVRPVNQGGATADRGTKNSSFDRTLAKLKTLKQNVVETAEAMSKDSLTASLAASQQAQTKQANPNDDGAAAKAVETVQDVEEPTSVKTVAANGGGAQAETLALAMSSVPAEETNASASVPSSTDEAVTRETTESSLQEGASHNEVSPMSSAGKIGAETAKLQMQQENVAQISHLAALLALDEKPEQNLLQALSGRSLPQMMQADLSAAMEQMNALGFASEMPQVSEPAEMSLTAGAESGAMLSDALLRTLAQQSTVSLAAAAISHQNGAMVQNTGQTTPFPLEESLDAKASLQPTLTANEQRMAGDSADDAFAELFDQQQAKQEQKAQGRSLFSPADSTLLSEEGAAKTKMDSSVESFVEAAQNPKTGSELQSSSQANPAVTFQAAMQETVEAQPAVPVAPQKDYEIAKQIVEQARLMRMPDETQMVIRLKPEHLGELTLKVSVAASGAVNATFHTDNAAVRTIIETSMIQLKHELQAQGLKVDNVGVYAGLGDSSMMNGQQDANAHYAQHDGQGSSQGHDVQQALASFEEEQQALTMDAQQGVLAQDGVDYRI